ncbi:NAD-dependent epimerase/dehydratase family protein [Pannonibacter phragmitetus]|uniref:NAD-dependent epimerase/dehydratase family protein n=1 Tax=Pannonibacter phragmitetus TaxID=121719 RepID=UPI000F457B6B|nr:NAD-dependent epimerase/dehydratase family protein [Pannonibacter phragmitetus]
MRVLITGANGFLGRGLAARAAQSLKGLSSLTLTDRVPAATAPAGALNKPGDLSDPAFLDDLLAPGFDLVFHLASIPGSAAEQEPEAGNRVNLLAPIALARGVAKASPGARFVFASSIAVYGQTGDAPVNENTATAPALTYGAHKLMTEILLSDLTRRGELSAVSLRLPGIVARPRQESGHGSAFMSLLFHHASAGEDWNCPVPGSSTCWWMSREAAASVMIHAASLPAGSASVIQPPALHATVQEVAEAAARVTGKPSGTHWGDNETLRRIFGAMPPLDASRALSLGFAPAETPEALARAALSGVADEDR